MATTNKDLARAQFKELRKSIPAEERARIDCEIADRLTETLAWKNAKTVLAYLAFGSEVDTRNLIEQALNAGKIVALPRCVPNSRKMEWYRVNSLDGLERSSFGMEEPVANSAMRIDEGALDATTSLAIVPGLAFDIQGYRVGYGGGFYDTFLAIFPGVSVGLCRQVALQRDLRQAGLLELHDRPVDIVVTDQNDFAHA